MATTTRPPAAPAPDTMFASRSLREHWIRGAIGLVLAIAAFALIPLIGPVALVLILPAGIAWRGCVSCWALGLSQTKAACQVRQQQGRDPAL